MAQNKMKYKQFVVAQLPATFMINEDGLVVDLFRADNLLDSMPFERLEAFIPDDKRCKCNKHDCIASRCRKEYEECKREAEAGIFLG